MINIGIVNKGRLFSKSLQYLKKRNLKILYDKDKRSLSGKIIGMKHISINFLHARSVIDLLSQNILSVGISGLDLLEDEIPSKKNKIKVVKRLDFGIARIMMIVHKYFVDVNTCADLEAISEELRKKDESLICSTKYVNLAKNFFLKKNIKNFTITKSLGATELDCAQNRAHMLIDVVESGKTIKSNNLKTFFSDSKIMDTSAVLLANKQALKNKNVAKIVKLLSK